MDGDFFVHDGKLGQWRYQVYQVHLNGVFSASAGITLEGTLRCRIVLSLPHAARAAGIEMLKRKCMGWIGNAETEGARSLAGKRKPAGAG